MLTHTRTYTTCAHDPDRVVADVLQGDGDFPPRPLAVQWCRVCGAVRTVDDPMTSDRREGEWREPEGPDGDGVKFF